MHPLLLLHVVVIIWSRTEILKQVTLSIGVSAFTVKMYCFLIPVNTSLIFHSFIHLDTWGGDLGLEVVPGIGPNGSPALKTVAPRGWYDRSQAQVLNTECVNEGDRIAFSAKIKSDANCLIYSWDSNQRCNNLHLYTRSESGMREYNRVGTITADTPDADGW